MSDGTKIEWTDATWNPITGCAVVSPGCIHCYAMRLAGTRLRNIPSRKGLTTESKTGPIWNGKVRFNEEWLNQPERWRRPRMVFVCAHGDLFAENVPYEWIDRVFAVMASARWHTFQVLTKRPGRMLAYLQRYKPDGQGWLTPNGEDGYQSKAPLNPQRWPLPNVWLGVSAERQQEADERIPVLLQAPAAVRFISAEPLLGPIDLRNIQTDRTKVSALDLPGLGKRLDWVIAGGESGSGFRPMEEAWARSIRDQCRASGVAFFMKQTAGKGPIPNDLLVREFPQCRAA